MKDIFCLSTYQTHRKYDIFVHSRNTASFGDKGLLFLGVLLGAGVAQGVDVKTAFCGLNAAWGFGLCIIGVVDYRVLAIGCSGIGRWLFCVWCVRCKWGFGVVFYFIRGWGGVVMLYYCRYSCAAAFRVGWGVCPVGAQCFSGVLCVYL